MIGRASFDATGEYRYTLLREWDKSGPRLGMVLLNPSTADATANDPTIRRCIGFAQDWKFGSLEAVNLFALRSTFPDVLRHHADPSGPRNLMAIRRCASRADKVIAAWGNHGRVNDQEARALRVLADVDIYHLGLTKIGCPKHPLYLAAVTKPALWTLKQRQAALESASV